MEQSKTLFGAVAVPRKRLNFTRVDYRCIHCQQNLGDPDRQRSPFRIWVEAVRVHVLFGHPDVSEPLEFLANAHIAATYS